MNDEISALEALTARLCETPLDDVDALAEAAAGRAAVIERLVARRAFDASQAARIGQAIAKGEMLLAQLRRSRDGWQTELKDLERFEQFAHWLGETSTAAVGTLNVTG